MAKPPAIATAVKIAMGQRSAFQSLGADHPRWTPRLLAFGKAVAVLIAAGFIFIAVWVYVQTGRVRV